MSNTTTSTIDTTTGSPDRFGYEWGEYAELVPIYEEQFKRWSVLIPESEWQGKTFLDVGCGMGRNSHWPLSYGAAKGVSIDVDDRSLASAKQTLAQHNNVQIRQLSAYDIDYENEFDITFSIGVIHHLEFPETALKKMVAATKPGGKVMIWVYGNQNMGWIKYFDPIRKGIFAKLPIGLTHFLSLFPTAFLWTILRLGLGRIEYYKLLRRFSFRHLRSIVFDQMLPHIAHYWTHDEVKTLMESANLQNIQIQDVNDMSWCAVGIKPE